MAVTVYLRKPLTVCIVKPSPLWPPRLYNALKKSAENVAFWRFSALSARGIRRKIVRFAIFLNLKIFTREKRESILHEEKHRGFVLWSSTMVEDFLPVCVQIR